MTATKVSEHQRWMLRDLLAGRLTEWPEPSEHNRRRTLNCLFRSGYAAMGVDGSVSITPAGAEWLRYYDAIKRSGRKVGGGG